MDFGYLYEQKRFEILSNICKYPGTPDQMIWELLCVLGVSWGGEGSNNWMKLLIPCFRPVLPGLIVNPDHI